jgi:5-methyltetrahydropteroyltriglutamate--homocysteine methyltransferase
VPLLNEYAGSVLAVNFGSYPRIGDSPGEQKLRRALHSLDRGEISSEELSAVERDVIKTVLNEQAEAGIDIVTDGLIRWNDPVSHLARGLEGCEITGLLRYFDNNFYYRQPVLTGPVRWQRPILLDDLEYAHAAADRPLKAVITGPLTFTALSKDDHYGSATAATMAVAEALNRELHSWQELDLVYVQVEEPVFGPKTDRGLLRDSYTALTRDLSLPVVVAPFFGNVSRTFTQLYELFPRGNGKKTAGKRGAEAGATNSSKGGVAGFHLDVRSHAENAAAFDPAGFPAGASLSFGVLDARNTRMEELPEVGRELEAVRSRLPESCPLLVTTNCGLEFLPRDAARAKLRLLAEARDQLVAAPR